MSYLIEDAARLVGVTSRTIKRWEDAGRIEPVFNESGYRVYDDDYILVLKALARKSAPKAQERKPHADTPRRETYNIGFGDYPKIAPEDAVAYLHAAKARAFRGGGPQPTEQQLAFRRKVMSR